MRVGVTGHRLLPAETIRVVERALHERLVRVARFASGAFVGISSLADGADQLFADAVLALGGSLEVVVPAEQYRADLPADHRPEYDRLLGRAVAVEQLTYRATTDEAHMAAGRRLVDRSDLVVAVWDGQPARGLGGTADVVAYARERGVPVEVVWPDGVSRG